MQALGSKVKFVRVVCIFFSMSFSVPTGYFLAVGITSFAICYQHGPLTTELSINLLTWMLQLTAFVLIYFGVTIPQVAYAVIAVSLCSKGLCYPLGAACHIARSVSVHQCPSPGRTRKYWKMIMKKNKPLHFNNGLRISCTCS